MAGRCHMLFSTMFEWLLAFWNIIQAFGWSPDVIPKAGNFNITQTSKVWFCHLNESAVSPVSNYCWRHSVDLQMWSLKPGFFSNILILNQVHTAITKNGKDPLKISYIELTLHVFIMILFARHQTYLDILRETGKLYPTD